MIIEKPEKSKNCSLCGKTFPLTPEFYHVSRAKKDGFIDRCKNCRSEYAKRYRNTNKEKVTKDKFEYSIKNKEKIIKYKAGFYQKNKEAIKNKSLKYRNAHKDKVFITQRNYRKKNKKKLSAKKTEYSINNKEKISKQKRNQRESSAVYSIHAHGILCAEVTKKGSNGELIVLCAYCGKEFIPTVMSVARRTQCLNGATLGEGRLYCSTGCKISCPIFHKSKWPKGFKKASSRESNPLLRQLVLKRDNYTCQKCGATTGGKIQLHCHHVVPARQNPMTANDPDVCITLCKDCHKAAHKKPGCGYHELKCA